MRECLRKLGPVLVAMAAACGGEPAPEPAAGTATAVAAPQRAVVVTSPAEGEVVAGPAVTVRMEARGFTVVAAGDTTPNSGHLHLFLDRDLSPAGQPIPVEAGHIVHMGTGASEFAFDAVDPGEHVLIAVVGDAIHVPIQPWIVDTVRFTVR